VEEEKGDTFPWNKAGLKRSVSIRNCQEQNKSTLVLPDSLQEQQIF